MAGRGPLPTGTAIRRNKPTIPTTSLPADGRKGPVPDPPATYELGPKAADWWAWAWTTPQAAAWSDGDLFALARRAMLEDDIDALGAVDLDLAELLGIDDGREAVDRLEAMIRSLKGMASGKLQLMREARELDDRFGLTAKGMAALRWKIVDDAGAAGGSTPKAPARSGDRRQRLRSVG